MNHYLYRIVHIPSNRKYIGIRSCECMPKEDTRYRGSGVVMLRLLNVHPEEEFVKMILYIGDSREDVAELEELCVDKEYVARENTLNLITGGEETGCRLFTKEMKANHSKVLKRKFSSPEMKAKMKASKNTPEFKAKCSKATKQMWANSEYREKTSNAIREANNKPERKERARKVANKQWSDPVARKNASLRMKEKCKNPEFKEKLAEYSRKACDTPEKRKKMSELKKAQYKDNPRMRENARLAACIVMNRPGRKEQMATSTKKAWKDPEFKKKHVGMVTCYYVETEVKKKIPRAEYFKLRDEGKVLGINSNAYKLIKSQGRLR